MIAIINELPDFLEIFSFHEFWPSTWLMMIITPLFTSLRDISLGFVKYLSLIVLMDWVAK